MRDISLQTARCFRATQLTPLGLAGPTGDELEQNLAQSIDEAISDLINTPEIDDFFTGIAIEARHQFERWGPAHDRQKTAADWFWLVAHLLSKALQQPKKRQHHIISGAAALYHWHDSESGPRSVQETQGLIAASPSERAIS